MLGPVKSMKELFVTFVGILLLDLKTIFLKVFPFLSPFNWRFLSQFWGFFYGVSEMGFSLFYESCLLFAVVNKPCHSSPIVQHG